MVYYVTYESSFDGDCCTVWTEANSKEQAISNVKSEYCDVKEILQCRGNRRQN